MKTLLEDAALQSLGQNPGMAKIFGQLRKIIDNKPMYLESTKPEGEDD